MALFPGGEGLRSRTQTTHPITTRTVTQRLQGLLVLKISAANS